MDRNYSMFFREEMMQMKVFIIEPRMTMTEVGYANQFNEEVLQQLKQYGIEHYLVNDYNMQRKM